MYTIENSHRISRLNSLLPFGLLLLLFACQGPSPEKKLESQPKTNSSTAGERLFSKQVLFPNTSLSDSCFQRIIMYNENEQLREAFDFYNCDSLYKLTTYGYDAKRLIQTGIHSDLEIVFYNWIYNEEGQAIEMQANKQTQFFPNRIRYSYNEEGQQIGCLAEMATTEFEGNNYREEYEYQAELKSWTKRYRGPELDELEYKIQHYYNEKGEEIMQVRYLQENATQGDTSQVILQYKAPIQKKNNK